MAKLLTEHRPGDVVEKVLLVCETELKTARTGNMYISAALGDKSGTMAAKLWNATREIFETFGVDDFVAVRGRVQDFKGELQLILESVIWQDPSTVSMAEMLPCTERDTDEMFAEIRSHIGGIGNGTLRALLEAVFADDRIREGFITAPAAVSYHHAWIGGLLEHTCGVCRLAELVCKQHPQLDAGLLTAAAILHDIGKIDEFVYTRSFRYSDAGGLVGHTVIGVGLVDGKAREIEDFPPDLLNMLRHLILSHHGEHDYGAPVLPSTAEALALHHIDNLDAKLNAFDRLIRDDPNNDSRWTDWSRMFERRLFKWRPGGNGDL